MTAPATPPAPRVETILAEAVEIPDPTDRAAYLDRACGGDPGLRGLVERLAADHFRAGSFLERPPAAVIPGETAPFRPGGGGATAGDVIAGRYKLVEEVGEGGMGTVFLAQQTEPVRRAVAVKLIKPGMDSRAVLARFEAERQALALMDHPNIAKVLDGGLTPDGRPFFVMELVKGVPITRFCDERRLTPRERLELFVPVCQAVQHAHQKGVIHRDIKPSNVLVALYDDKPVPKVIDFGVAKAAGQPLTDKTLLTGLGAVVGTPQYMSPEQATLNNLDVDTRTDVYSLGVLLYELLAGTPPFSREELEQKGLLEILRVVREEEPPKPSTKLSTADALPTLSANRGSEPGRLTRLLRGELDWVVMRALEKDRSRRYESANAFAADVQRYLSGEPVAAHPPSAGYRVRKFARRNRPQVVAAGLVLVALLAGIAGTTVGLIRAEASRRDAVSAQAAEAERAGGERVARIDAQAQQRKAEAAAAAEKAARAKEAEERAFAQAIADFVRDDFLALTTPEGQDLFAGEDRVELDRNLTLRQMLDRAAGKLERRADLAPRTEADLRWMIGLSYRWQGEYGLAVRHLERCAALRQQALGADHLDTLLARNSLGVAYTDDGRFPEAIKLLERVRDARVARLGADHPATLATLHSLAGAYEEAGQLPRATELLEQVRDARVAKLGADHPATLNTLNSLALAHLKAGRFREAIKLLEQVRDTEVVRLGADHPATFTNLNNLAAAYKKAGQLPRAIELFEKVRDAHVTKLGADHPNTFPSTGAGTPFNEPFGPGGGPHRQPPWACRPRADAAPAAVLAAPSGGG